MNAVGILTRGLINIVTPVPATKIHELQPSDMVDVVSPNGPVLVADTMESPIGGGATTTGTSVSVGDTRRRPPSITIKGGV